jgi:hypothetical protein
MRFTFGALMTGALGLVMGCSSEFQVAGEQFNNLTPISETIMRAKGEVTTADGTVRWETKPSAQVQTQMQAQVQAQLLALGAESQTAGGISEGSTLFFDVSIPFARVYQASDTAIRLMAPLACTALPELERESPLAYRPGEIPCGRFASDGWKRLMNVSVEPTQGTESGFRYTVSGTTLPVWISRDQRSGTYIESNLTTRTEISRSSSTQFGRDVSVRFDPQGQSALWTACANLPGATVTSPATVISAKAERNILGFRASYGSEFDVQPGRVTYDYARACLQTRISWPTTQLAPVVQTSLLAPPAVVSAQYEGLRIGIRDWFLRLVDQIIGWFRSSIKTSVERQITQRGNTILDQDVESGRWFSKVHGEDTVRKFGESATRQTLQTLTRLGIPSQAADLKLALQDSCRRIRISRAELWTDKLQTLCKDLIANTEITITPFVRDASQDQSGCYNHFVRLAESSSRAWWHSECGFRARFEIRVSSDLISYLDEIKLLVVNRVVLDRLSEAWRSRLATLQIDELTGLLLLEELERRGVLTDNPGLISVSTLDEVLNLIRLRWVNGV